MKNEFTDINFKLAVVQVLMFEKQLLSPKFSLLAFIDQYKKREIDKEKEGYEIIPEALQYFEDMVIPAELLTQIEEIYQDGGNEIYGELYPFWDGEDDSFNITSTDDLHLLPNLKKITLFYDDAEEMVDAFNEKGVEAEYL